MIIDLMLLPSILCSVVTTPTPTNSQEADYLGKNQITEGYECDETQDNSIRGEKRESLSPFYDLDVNWDEIRILLSLTPLQFTQAKAATDRAIEYTEDIYDGFSQYLDDGDAFRHTYWSALLASYLGDALALNLTTAHESQEVEGVDKNMDLHNNKNGIALYHEWIDKVNYSGSDPLNDLGYFICHCIANGEVYNCVKVDTTIDKLIYTTVGINNVTDYGIKGFIDYMTPDLFGFEQQYYFYNKTRYVSTYNESTIETRRLRTGFIENEYIVLSPRRQNAGYAYLEMYFDSPILAIQLDICLWSEYEFLDPTDSSIKVAKKTSYYDFVTYYDLLNDYSLSTDRTNPDGLRFDFPNQASGIMFSATSSAIGDRNKGRVCLGNMHIIYANPNY